MKKIFKFLHGKYCEHTNCKIVNDVKNGDKKKLEFCREYCEIYLFLKWLHDNDYKIKKASKGSKK